MNEKETGRQIIHASGIILVYFILTLGRYLTFFISAGMTFFLFILSLYKGNRHSIRKSLPFRVKFFEKIENVFFDMINSLERKKAYPYYGAFSFYLASTIVLFFFSKEIAMLAIAVLAIEDSVSTLIGIHYGKTKLFWNTKKSFEGMLFGFFAALLVCLLLANPLKALIAAVSGALIETLPIEIDDNLTIPIGTAILLVIF